MKHLRTLFIASLAILLSAIAANAQPGSSMTNPIVLGPGSQTLSTQSPVGTETWYMWQSIDPDFMLGLKVMHAAGAINIHSAEIHGVDANGNPVFTYTDTLDADSTLGFTVINTPADLIYIKLNGVPTSCGSCILEDTQFDMQLTSFTATACGWTPDCNYVKDGDFEHYYLPCGNLGPTNGAYTNNAFPGCYWVMPIDGCPQTPIIVGTPDYFNTCATQANYGTPAPPAPYSGSGYAGIYAAGQGFYYNGNWVGYDAREYMTNTLYQPITNGTYTISMYVRLKSNSQLSIPQIQAWLTNGNPGQCGLITVNGGQLINVNSANTDLNNKTSWQQISTNFSVTNAPSGGYTHLVIGNFKSDANSSINPNNGGNSQAAYYYIDNVVIDAPAATPITVTESMNEFCVGQSATLTATGAETYTWSPATGLNATTGGVVIATPSVTTTYTVTGFNSFGCATTQTITIYVQNCCENPVGGSIKLSNANIVAYGTPGAIAWPFLPGVYSGNIALPNPSGIVYGGYYTVWGSLTINAPTTFDNTDITFDEAVQVTQYAPLTIDHSWWHTCGYMWQGINSRNYIKVTNSIIEDASNAISIGLISNHSGIYVDNSVFNKNKYGVSIALATVNTSLPNNFRITGSVFTCKALPGSTYNFPLGAGLVSSLIGPNNTIMGTATTMVGSPVLGISTTRSEAGIYTASALPTSGNFFNIGNSSNNTTQNAQIVNYFCNLNSGIQNRNSRIHVVNCNFQEIITVSAGVALGGIFHDHWNGGNITTTNVGDLNSAQKACIFQNSLLGISAKGGGIMNVSSNTFKTEVYGSKAIEVMNWYSPLSNGSPTGTVDIIQNSFTKCYKDLYAYDNSSIRLIFQGNNSSGTTAEFIGAEIAELSSAPNALYRIDGNMFIGKARGIYLSSLHNTNITDNTILLADISGSSGGYGIYNNSCFNNLYSNNSISSVKGSYNNIANSNVLGILTANSTGNTICSNTITSIGICLRFQGSCTPVNVFSNSLNLTGSPAILGINLLNGNTGNMGTNANGNWYSGENAFGSFSNGFGNVAIYSQVSSNIPQSNLFYDGTAPTSAADLSSNSIVPVSASPIAGGPLCPSATFRFADDSTAIAAHPSISWDEIPYIARKEMYYLAKTYEQYSNVLPVETMSSCAESNIGKLYAADSLVNDFITTQDQASLSAFGNLSSSLLPENNIETYQQEFNNIYLSYLSKDSTAMIGHINSLRSLASKCPLTDGNAIFQARALLSHYDTTVYYNPCEYMLNPLSYGVSSENANEELVQLYPNPTAGEITVKGLTEESKVEVYNLLGVKVASYVLTSEEPKLDVSILKSGTYLFKIVNKEKSEVHKIMINN